MKPKKDFIKEKVQSQLNVLIDGNIDDTIEDKPQNLSQVELLDEGKIKIEAVTYQIVENYRDAVTVEGIAKRYNSILNKYDYIVGDWGYDQLRLKGFYQDSNNRAGFDKKISFLEDYLYEYCNFGCAYFVLEKETNDQKKIRNKRKRKRNKEPQGSPVLESKNNKKTSKKMDHIEQKKEFVIKNTDKQKQANTKQKMKPVKNIETPKTSFQIHNLED